MTPIGGAVAAVTSAVLWAGIIWSGTKIAQNDTARESIKWGVRFGFGLFG